MPPAYLETIDTRLNLLLPSIDGVQSLEFGALGKYVQEMATHLTPPDGGAMPDADGLDDHPTDQPSYTSWRGLSTKYGTPLPTRGMAQLSITSYDGPLGHGYVLNVVTTSDGETWQRARNIGPETWRETAWSRLDEE